MQYRKLTELKKLTNNPRIIRDKEFKNLCRSIKDNPKFFEARPLILSNRTGELIIIAGNQRYEAAKALKMKEAPTYLMEGLTEEKEKEITIRDNTNQGEWDMDLLSAWDDLPLVEWGLDLPEDWLTPPPVEGTADAEPQIDRAKELNKIWQVKPGDLFQIGEHRLLCGDSTKKEDVERVMGGERAHLCFTSPPYGQQRDYDGDTKEKVSDWDSLMRGVFGNLPMADDGQVLVNLGMIHRDGEWWPYWDGWIAWMRDQGWRRFGWYVWDQGSGLPGDWHGRLAPSHEWIFHFNRVAERPEKWVKKQAENIGRRGHGTCMRGKDGKTKGMSSPELCAQPNKIPDSVIRVNRQIGRIGENIDHPAPFSVGFAEFIVRTWDGIAYEPFLGSGTTMVACENLHRKCRGIEISAPYVAVCLERMKTAFPGIEIRRIK